jgi:hypothetical protein
MRADELGARAAAHDVHRGALARRARRVSDGVVMRVVSRQLTLLPLSCCRCVVHSYLFAGGGSGGSGGGGGGVVVVLVLCRRDPISLHRTAVGLRGAGAAPTTRSMRAILQVHRL